MKAQTYIKEFNDETKAREWMVMKNQTQRDGSIFCLVPGEEKDWAVVDLSTAIELGMGYEWSTSPLVTSKNANADKRTQFLVRWGIVEDTTRVYCILLLPNWNSLKPICSINIPNADARVKRFISSMEAKGYTYIES